MRSFPFQLALVFLLPAVSADAREPRTLDWLELMPAEDRTQMEKLPELMEELNADLLEQGDSLSEEVRMPDVLQSTAVVGELEGKFVRIPGYLVPLEINERGDAETFFLVPYFGACIHVPPPPPNQMVHVTFSGGLPPDAIYVPYWVTGELAIETTENELGVATYAIDATTINEYEYEDG
jgi:hypothetical protein